MYPSFSLHLAGDWRWPGARSAGEQAGRGDGGLLHARNLYGSASAGSRRCCFHHAAVPSASGEPRGVLRVHSLSAIYIIVLCQSASASSPSSHRVHHLVTIPKWLGVPLRISQTPVRSSLSSLAPKSGFPYPNLLQVIIRITHHSRIAALAPPFSVVD